MLVSLTQVTNVSNNKISFVDDMDVEEGIVKKDPNTLDHINELVGHYVENYIKSGTNTCAYQTLSSRCSCIEVSLVKQTMSIILQNYINTAIKKFSSTK